MTKKERYAAVLKWFQENAESSETELNYQNNYQLLIAVILSAQCTDKRVNIITPPFYNRFPTVDDLAKATEEEVFSLPCLKLFPCPK